MSATTYTLTAPATIEAGTAATFFVAPLGLPASTTAVTVHPGFGTGFPIAFLQTNGSGGTVSVTFPTAGTYNIYATNNQGLSDPYTSGSPLVVTVTGINTTQDLITVARACFNSKLAALNGSNPSYVSSLITGCSQIIQGQCMRDFNLLLHSEYYDALNYPYDVLQLRNFPITQMIRLATNPQQVISITNNNTATNQYADVSTTADANYNTSSVVLSWLASGVSATSTFNASEYTTLTALATAINAVGFGWTATVYTGYGSYATSTLRPYQGNISALGSGGCWLECYLDQPTFGGNGTFLNYGQTFNGSASQWRLDPKRGIAWGCFPGGQQGIRVDYIAGFAPVPEDLQQACMRLCVMMYENDIKNSTVTTEKIGPYSQSIQSNWKGYVRDPEISSVINRYRDLSKLAMS